MGDVTSIERKRRRRQPSLTTLMRNPEFRALATTLVTRSTLANVAGISYGGKRDMYQALGYPRVIFPADYRSRYHRNAVAARIIEAKPQSTWRGGGEVIEDQAPDTETEFEKSWDALNNRLKIWSMFQRTDILAGFGRYAVLLIGAPGDLDKPLVKLRGPQDLLYLTPFSEEDAGVQEFEVDTKQPRFGLPVFYAIRRMAAATPVMNSPLIGPDASSTNFAGKRVHFSRVIHVADGLLDDHVYGIPRLERCWNLLDDLDKVTGGGAEAFWRRADAGLQVDIDPDMELEPDDEEALDNEIDEYIHKLRRVVRTRGTKMTPLTSAVAGIKDPIDGIMSQISAGTGIPQRILMGSERGQLASTQDDDNWTQRIVDRRRDFAAPQMANLFIDRMIELKALPTPKQYHVGWPEIDNLDEVQKATIAKEWADINNKMGETVVTPNEIRDQLLNLPPLPAKDIKQLPSTNPATPVVNLNRFLRKWACLTVTQRHQYFDKFSKEKTA
jgi:hypothetical protein